MSLSSPRSLRHPKAGGPYRTAKPPSELAQHARWTHGGDTELLPVLAVFWVASVLRVICAFARHEIFATEATLAVCVGLVMPWLMKDPLAAIARRLWNALR